MNNDYEENEMSIEEYIKTFTNEEILENEQIKQILEDNIKYNFATDCRGEIEYMRQKYINLYSFGGIFKRDKNNANWERLFDLIYDNIVKNYNLGIVYNNPEKFIPLLEK
mgnify:CR=1 FL=1|tara:strand:+ start:974 stop:1303 length:330 start_codon:yes stop_codon:yes gene_type:complete